MPAEQTQPQPNAFGTLQRFVRRGPPEERCELCSAAVASEHEHLIEPANRKLVCVCQACAILFSGQSGQRYKRVRSRIRFLDDFRMTEAQWDGLMVPINMAFFFESSAAGKMVAIYPSPAGPVESHLELETWDQIVTENPVLRTMESDVEALLVNRLGTSRGFSQDQYFLLPIDQCFKLVGLVRGNWRGFSGGEELWQGVRAYFDSLIERSGFARESQHA